MYLSGLAFLPFLVKNIIRKPVVAPINNTVGIVPPILAGTRHWPPSHRPPAYHHPPCHPPVRRRRGCCC